VGLFSGNGTNDLEGLPDFGNFSDGLLFFCFYVYFWFFLKVTPFLDVTSFESLPLHISELESQLPSFPHTSPVINTSHLFIFFLPLKKVLIKDGLDNF